MRDDEETDLPGWLGLRKIPDLTKARWLGPLLMIGSGLIVGGLFLLALLTAFILLFSAAFGSLLDDPRSALGVGGVTVALIGAPFVIWRSVVAQKTVTLQEQGHITDRINAAVEGLGVEKVVDRIGRPITIWTGKPRTVTHQVDDLDKFALPPRAIEMRRYSGASLQGDPDLNDVFDGLHVEVKSWPEEKTMIEWQGTDIAAGKTEHLGKVGGWQVFSETQPNLEVRIGAIYALERIAQDSDRDHLQIMEILCAYIRQNAPADEADHGLEKDETGIRDPGAARKWSKSIPAPRADIQVALTIIGRRTRHQIGLERAPKVNGSVFKLNLKHTCLRMADLTGLDFSNAVFFEAQLDAVYFNSANIENANFIGCSMVGISAPSACFDRSRLDSADFTAAILDGATFRDADFQFTYFNGAQLTGTILNFAYHKALESRVNRAFFIDCNMRNALVTGRALPFGIVFARRNRNAEQLARSMQGFALRDTTILAGIFPQVCLDVCFGDGSVDLSAKLDRPTHWPKSVLTGDDFDVEWFKWQADPEGYRPPEPDDTA